MTGMEIVREEARRMLRGMVPLTLIAFGAFVLFGCAPLRAAVSLLLGACYSLLLFRMIGRSAVKAVLFPPEQGTRIVRRGYVFRYALTGVMIVLAIKAPFIHPLAAVLPLFFPKFILLWSSVFQRKGG
ncbi:MAG: ATP synthase subunit I [Eubacteriales bacterium]|nr:ATP synthase subunit I [Eubacteriales bacterium]